MLGEVVASDLPAKDKETTLRTTGLKNVQTPYPNSGKLSARPTDIYFSPGRNEGSTIKCRRAILSHFSNLYKCTNLSMNLFYYSRQSKIYFVGGEFPHILFFQLLYLIVKYLYCVILFILFQKDCSAIVRCIQFQIIV